MSRFIQVTPDFAVSPQISAADFAAAKAAGFAHVVNNRPDGEEAGQLTAAAAAAAAEAAGLGFTAIPISGMPGEAQVEAMAALLDAQSGPVLAYCRSGTRSITVWALAQALRRAAPAEDLVAAASHAGYDLRPHAPVLQRLSQG